MSIKTITIGLAIIMVSVIACSSEKRSAENDWVLVKGGEYTMGCSDSTDHFCSEDERPPRSVTVDAFLMNKYEVTVAEYKIFCDSTGHSMPKHVPRWGWIDDHPMVCVTLDDAAEYAKWKGARLPTEAEWEYAARGGEKGKGFRYSGGNDITEVGWCNENAKAHTYPVGEKIPNELDLFDMSGNAYEWCSTKFYPYDSTMTNKFPNHFILRGGCYADPAAMSRITARVMSLPHVYNYATGFRLAKSIE